MKTRLIVFLFVCCFTSLSRLHAQEGVNKDNRFETVSIKTSAVCGDCKARLEKNLAFEKGVSKVSLDDETKIITIEYRKGRNSKESLKKAITKIGYDADEMPADQKAHDRLPACCQKGNEPH
ncbi:MAG TPA: heavy-metal-associated domain-containing protein [Bacteroidales bacterium]|nr:heavy-metal-associated domain-containing protein [Bacteroidales bacterium]